MEYLSITVVAPIQSTYINLLIEMIAKYDCNLVRCRTATIGKHKPTIILASGSWNNIAKLETALQHLSEKDREQITLTLHRTELKTYDEYLFPYNMQIIGINDANTIHSICCFTSEQNIIIEDLYLDTTVTHNTTTPMFIFHATVHIPVSASLSYIREQFMLLCEELNIDGTIEPERKF
jgi:glycine cleavage system transcriptional repressor